MAYSYNDEMQLSMPPEGPTGKRNPPRKDTGFKPELTWLLRASAHTRGRAQLAARPDSRQRPRRDPQSSARVRAALTSSGSCFAICVSISDQFIGVFTQFARTFLPLAQSGVAELIFVADFHGEPGLKQIALVVRKDARNVIERCQAHTATAEEQRVVFSCASVPAMSQLQ